MKENKGFSLVEMLVVVAVMGIMASMLTIGPAVARRKEIDKFARTLKEQLEYTQAVSMTKTGRQQLTVYEKDQAVYCVREKKENESASWSCETEALFMGYSKAVTYTYSNSEAISEGDSSLGGAGETLYRIYRFDKDTGGCTMGSGALEIKGQGGMAFVTVYEETGYCEID